MNKHFTYACARGTGHAVSCSCAKDGEFEPRRELFRWAGVDVRLFAWPYDAPCTKPRSNARCELNTRPPAHFRMRPSGVPVELATRPGALDEVNEVEQFIKRRVALGNSIPENRLVQELEAKSVSAALICCSLRN